MTDFNYSWDDIPAGFDFAATDSSGQVFAYTNPPHPGGGAWFAKGTWFYTDSEINYCPNWKESLRQRPGVGND